MNLIPAQDNHFEELMTWFTDEETLSEWSGPGFRYPFTSASFKEDLKLTELSSFALVSEQKEFLAFGQYYNRIDRCHLGRLVVSPKLRGKGIAAKLMEQLCLKGLEALKVTECSLFVLAHNNKAIKAYEKFGFSFVDYPESIPLDNCLYMVKT